MPLASPASRAPAPQPHGPGEVPAPAAPAPRKDTPGHAFAVKGLWLMALILALKFGQALLAPLAVAVVLTLVFATPVRALRRYGVPEVVGAALVVVSLVAGTGLLAATMFSPAAQWWDRAPQTMAQLGDQIDKVRATIPGLAPPRAPVVLAPAALPATRAGRGTSSGAGAGLASGASPAVAPPAALQPAPADPVRDRLATEGLAITGALLGKGVMASVAVAATLILTYFLLASEHWMLARTVEAVPRRRTRALILGALRSAQREISRFLWTQALINAGVGVATALAMNALALPNPMLWGAVAATMNFIPYLGPMMTAGLLLLAGIVSGNEAVSVFAPMGAYIGVHLMESNLVTPYVIGRRLSLSPISVFLSVMLWGWLWGLVGAMIAVPLLVGLRAMCKRHRGLRWLCVYMNSGTAQPRSLASLLRPRARPALVPAAVHPRVRSVSRPLVRTMAGTAPLSTPSPSPADLGAALPAAPASRAHLAGGSHEPGGAGHGAGPTGTRVADGLVR